MSYMDNNRYWQRWTITINSKPEEAVRKAMSKVTSSSFNLLRMGDIFSMSSASTKIEDRKEGDKMRESEVTGYTEEGCCNEPRGAIGYEPEVVYEAHVNAYVSIYFMFSHRQNVKRVSVMRSDVSDGIWTNYTLGTVTEIHHNVPLGMWILRIHVGCQPDWLFKDKASGTLHKPTIAKAWGKHHPDRGRHYDTVIGDDIVSSVSTPEDVIKAIKWYKKAKKEVKGKMLQLIDVIFFNRKTKEIDFRKEIVAVDIEEAYMLAAQEYGKYNSEVHIRHANCLFSFVEDSKE